MASFADNEKVLCYHGPLLYEAKCLKSREKSDDGGTHEYFVHYQGWNKNWDEWVSDDRILQYNTANVDMKRKLTSEHAAAVRESKRRSNRAKGATIGQSPSSPAVSQEGESIKDIEVKRVSVEAQSCQLDSIDEKEDCEIFFPESDVLFEEIGLDATNLTVVMPEELKYVLVSDRDLVLNRKSVFNIPAKITVSTILTEFLRHVSPTTSTSKRTSSSRRSSSASAAKAASVALLNVHFGPGVVELVMDGLRALFDQRIPTLMYKSEWSQFVSQHKLAEKKRMCEIYGGAHLLRLMVNIEQLLGDVLTVTLPPPFADASVSADVDALTEASNDGDDVVDDDDNSSEAGSLADELEEKRQKGTTASPPPPLNFAVAVTVVNALLRYLDANRSRYFTSKNYVDRQ